jgi:hypothetical protein
MSMIASSGCFSGPDSVSSSPFLAATMIQKSSLPKKTLIRLNDAEAAEQNH